MSTIKRARRPDTTIDIANLMISDIHPATVSEALCAIPNRDFSMFILCLKLHRKKQEAVESECKHCFVHKFKIAETTNPKPEDKFCEACECSPCDCDYGNSEEKYWKMWGDI